MDHNKFHNIQPDACIDRPDYRDWRSDDICGSVVEIPERVNLWETPIYNQTLDKSTEYACTLYGLTHSSNEENFEEFVRNKLSGLFFTPKNPNSFIDAAQKAGWFNPIKGGALQDALKFFRDDLKLISGWGRITSFEGVKQALARGNTVYTGSNQADWTTTASTGIFTPATSSYGHAFMFDGYDGDEMGDFLWLRNSGGVTWGLAGRCKLYVENFRNLFSAYEVFDQSSADIISNFRKKMDTAIIQALKEAGITNGERPNDNVTRQETWLMLGRTLQKLDPAFSEKVKGLFNK
jgi:hypothetical protein